MRSRNRFLIAIVVAAVGVVLGILFSPMLIAKGVRSWLWWKTRGSNVTIKIDTIEAPFLRPIVLHGVRMQTGPNAELRVDASAKRIVFALNLQGILLRTRGRTLRSLQIDGLHAEFRRNKSGTLFSEDGWNTVHRLLPESFGLEPFDLRLEDGATLVLLRGVSLTGTPVEAGRFQASEVVISSPMVRQTFSNLRGATDWQSDRLTIAGLTLSRGLDVQSITTDFSHIGKRRVAVEFDLDAFGGKLRGSVADEWRSRRSNWNMAGSASDISVSQTAEALGFTDRVGGLIHAGKFTFRGDLNDALTGTASLWVELTGPAWRDREADVIMIGLSMYGRQLELQQLYIKQKKNQLTLNGESSFPTTATGWLHPDFRGTVSASIDDLGEFANLFGANRNDFAGRVEVEGTLDARDRNVGGNLAASGSGLTMFKSSIDEFHADLKLKRNETEIVNLELKRKNDVVRAHGKIDNSAEHNYSGAIDVTMENIDDYLSVLFGQLGAPPTSTTLHATITSSVWEAHAVVDPPHSKPIEFIGTFPLRIGQPLNAIWNSPVTLTLNIPDLRLAEIPKKAAHGRFESGTLNAQLSINDTLRHPRITGYAQLKDGRVGSTSLDTRIRFDGANGAIEFLNLVGSQNGASFFGDLNFQDTQHLIARLFPNQPLYDLTGPMLDCVTRIDVVPSTLDPAATQIGEVEVSGGIGDGAWNLHLQEPGPNQLLGSLLPDFSGRTFRFCSATKDSEVSLRLGVQPPVSPSPTPQPPRHRKRKR